MTKPTIIAVDPIIQFGEYHTQNITDDTISPILLSLYIGKLLNANCRSDLYGGIKYTSGYA